MTTKNNKADDAAEKPGDVTVSIEELKAKAEEAHLLETEYADERRSWMRKIAEVMFARRKRGVTEKVTLFGEAYVLDVGKDGLRGEGLKVVRVKDLVEVG